MLTQHPDSHTLKYVGELSTARLSFHLVPPEEFFLTSNVQHFSAGFSLMRSAKNQKRRNQKKLL